MEQREGQAAVTEKQADTSDQPGLSGRDKMRILSITQEKSLKGVFIFYLLIYLARDRHVCIDVSKSSFPMLSGD